MTLIGLLGLLGLSKRTQGHIYRRGQRAVQESRSETYQGHVMNLLHQYVCGMIKLNWSSESRRRVRAGEMREATQ